MKDLDKKSLLDLLETLAPAEGAAEWDNTGLLVESGPAKPIKKILLTLDLTPAVAAEAIKGKTDWIIAYHPPIFSGLKTLSRANPLTAALLDLITAGIQVYSPHTALDAAEGGISDWLASAFPDGVITLREGSGRHLTFPKALRPEEVAERIQNLIQAPYLRIAKPAKSKKIKTLGLCPGAGASVLREMTVDAVFTGEMRHHDILAWQTAGAYVFLSEHGHTERPYLKKLQQSLKNLLPSTVKVELSRKDVEPVVLVLPHA